MKTIIIEVPTWLGDAVMTTPAIENIITTYPSCKLIIFGSFVSTRLFLGHPNLHKIIIDNSKEKGNRYLNLYSLAKSVGKVDIAISFRKNITTKFFLFFTNANKKFVYRRYTKVPKHQVIRYNDFVNKSLSIDTKPNKLKIYLNKKEKNTNNKIIGINPGATYGSAKRWYPLEFASLCIKLSEKYDIVIFGGPNEKDIAKDIENILIENNISNYSNIAGLTSVEELIEGISNLDLFITNDSGPMHVAAAFEIPSICIFGPTKDNETSQWDNKLSQIVKKDYDCMPCMKRECPLEGDTNHQCMKNISYSDVLISIEKLCL